MYPGSLPLIFNGSMSVPGQKIFNVRRCTMYTGVQFGRFHCILKIKKPKIYLTLIGLYQDMP